MFILKTEIDGDAVVRLALADRSLSGLDIYAYMHIYILRGDYVRTSLSIPDDQYSGEFFDILIANRSVIIKQAQGKNKWGNIYMYASNEQLYVEKNIS